MSKHSTTIQSIGLDKVGITSARTIYRNLSYDELFSHETAPDVPELEKGTITTSGAVAVDTGRFTGRSPKDKYIVVDPESEAHVWWAKDGSDNKPMQQEVWNDLKTQALHQLNGKNLYVIDAFCGANPATRLSIRLVTEIAWKAHFAKNMFIRPTEAELQNFKPDWTILDACKTSASNWKELGLNSEVAVAFHIKERTTLIGGTLYGGEIKKGIFTMMNYFLPLKGIGSYHCSANTGKAGDTALFFGLSGTGKTTLSTDPKRALIGDDEHGWDRDGIFNFECGCYAKTINLSADSEADIFHAIRRDALLENVVIKSSRDVDYASSAKTENTRVSYPLHHIENIVQPVSKGGHPRHVIFLTADAYGVLPPVARLSLEQAKYQYLLGYTAKVAGTEIGIKEPTATFSACFGKAFLMLHPTKYGEILGKQLEQHGAQAWLVNTGWSGGAYGVGKRMSIKTTRTIIDAILDGSLSKGKFEKFPIFGFDIPTMIAGIEANMLNPRNTWADKAAYDMALKKLAGMFIEAFKSFTDTSAGNELASHGPHL